MTAITHPSPTPEGYTHAVTVYAGKSETSNSKGKNPHGHEVVMQLINGLENSGRVVIADNFYTSVGLAEDLIKKKDDVLWNCTYK